MLGVERLPDRDCPAAAFPLAGLSIDPFPGEAVPYTTLDGDGIKAVAAGEGGGPRYQEYDLHTGAKLADKFVGDPESRAGLVLVPVGGPAPVESALASIPQRVFGVLADHHWPGVAVLHGVPVTSTPAQAPFAGSVTWDGRPYDSLPAASYPATVDVSRATAQEVRHEVAHDWLRVLGDPVPPTTPGSWATAYERGRAGEYAAELVARVWGGLPVDPAERDWVISLGG